MKEKDHTRGEKSLSSRFQRSLPTNIDRTDTFNRELSRCYYKRNDSLRYPRQEPFNGYINSLIHGDRKPGPFVSIVYKEIAILTKPDENKLDEIWNPRETSGASFYD